MHIICSGKFKPSKRAPKVIVPLYYDSPEDELKLVEGYNFYPTGNKDLPSVPDSSW